MPGVNIDPISGGLEGMGQKEGEEYTKAGWCKQTVLLDSTSDLKGFGRTATEADWALHVGVEGGGDAEECRWTAYPL